MTETNESKNPAAPATVVLPLAELFPLCFSWENPQPLKRKIHQDLMNLGYDKVLVKRSLGRYCSRARYGYRVRAGTMRVDLNGQHVGMVTEEEADQMRHARQQHAERQARAQAVLPVPETRLPEDHLVPGRLELNVKFSDLPKPLAVQGGMKIGIQTGEGVVTAILPVKLWKKLEQAAKDYPQWVAALSGSLDRFKEGEVAIKHPALQIFEKKPKPAADSLASVPTAVAALSTVEATPPTPVEAQHSPTEIRPTLRLKNKSQKAG